MSGCGHRCCEIPSNGYHTHAGGPSECPRCARFPEPTDPWTTAEHAIFGSTAAVDSSGAAAGVLEPAAGDAGRSSESFVLGRIVADVVARVAPQIPGLPSGTELTELVASHALAVYAAGLVENDLQVLDDRDRRTVLAARVGMALAFPA